MKKKQNSELDELIKAMRQRLGTFKYSEEIGGKPKKIDKRVLERTSKAFNTEEDESEIHENTVSVRPSHASR